MQLFDYIVCNRCVAQVIEEGFTPYYAAIIPGIKQILRSSKDAAAASLSGSGKSSRKSNDYALQAAAQMTLCGKAMECIGKHIFNYK